MTNLLKAGPLAALALSLSAGAAIHFPDYPVKHAAAYGFTTAAAGLTIGVEPVEDPKDQENYFHAGLTTKGFLPIFIVIENNSADDSFLFDKAALTFGATPEARSKTGEDIGIVSAVAISPLGMLVAAKLISHASQVQENLLKKEIQSKTLSPGAATHGFLFAPVPKKGSREKLNLRVPITRLSDNEKLLLDLTF
jgi:hypothetical protein